jgi:hypothetical protein
MKIRDAKNNILGTVILSELHSLDDARATIRDLMSTMHDHEIVPSDLIVSVAAQEVLNGGAKVVVVRSSLWLAEPDFGPVCGMDVGPVSLEEIPSMVGQVAALWSMVHVPALVEIIPRALGQADTWPPVGRSKMRDQGGDLVAFTITNVGDPEIMPVVLSYQAIELGSFSGRRADELDHLDLDDLMAFCQVEGCHHGACDVIYDRVAQDQRNPFHPGILEGKPRTEWAAAYRRGVAANKNAD